MGLCVGTMGTGGRTGRERLLLDGKWGEKHVELDNLASFQAGKQGKAFWKEYDLLAALAPILGEEGLGLCDLPVVELGELEGEEGEEKAYVGAGAPILIRGGMGNWPDSSAFSLDSLVETHGGEDVSVKDPRRKGVVNLSAYAEYMEENSDADPAYVFDGHLLENHADSLGTAYARPPGLEMNLWDGMPPELKPETRWVLLGPARSGTPFHTDPFNTTAWNALVEGHKLWALYPKETYAPPGIYGSERPGMDPKLCLPPESWGGPAMCDTISALEWFVHTAPGLGRGQAPVYCVQHPGDVMFVPEGYWHAVLNLDATVAVTENSINRVNAREMLEATKRAAFGEPEYAKVIAAMLDLWGQVYPDLFDEQDIAFVDYFVALRGQDPESALAASGEGRKRKSRFSRFRGFRSN